MTSQFLSVNLSEDEAKYVPRFIGNWGMFLPYGVKQAVEKILGEGVRGTIFIRRRTRDELVDLVITKLKQKFYNDDFCHTNLDLRNKISNGIQKGYTNSFHVSEDMLVELVLHW